MQGTGKTYEVSGETTEWEDILIKKGITTKEDVLLNKGLNPADFEQKPQVEYVEVDKMTAKLAMAEDLDDLDDDPNFSDTRVLEEYREARLRQLQQERVQNRFGDVVEIVKDEWISQVNESSQRNWVVVHLYQDSVIECRLVEEHLQTLASKFKYIKFLKIRSTQAIENWPESKLPTLFAYRDGEMKHQMLTLREAGGKSAKADDLEWWLFKKGIAHTSELEEDPRLALQQSAAGAGRNGKITAAATFASERNNDYDDNDD